MAAQTKKFNARTATKVEFDRELKRIASAKCIALGKIRQAEAAGDIDQQALKVRRTYSSIGMLKALLIADDGYEALLGLALENIAHLIVERH